MKLTSSSVVTTIDSVLYSYAQIMFSNRRWLGAIVLAATFFRPDIAFAALAAAVISNSAAYLLKFDFERIRSGFYGFNGILFGAVFAYFVEINHATIIPFVVLSVATFLFSVVLEHHLAAVFDLPGLSLPFIVTTYLTLIFLKNFDGVVWNHINMVPQGAGILPHSIERFFVSLSQILVQNSVYAGVAILFGTLLFSRVSFVLTIVGVVSARICFALLLPDRGNDVLTLLELNAIFVAIALGGSLIISTLSSLLVSAGVIAVLTIFVGVADYLGAKAYLPVLVLPFNLVVLATIYGLKFRPATSGLTLLYFKPGSPEENVYYHQSRLGRFKRFSQFMVDPPFHGKWLVTQSHDGAITHGLDWKYALDFECRDEQGMLHDNHGADLKDYYCYRLPVAAPLDGTISRIVDHISNNPAGATNLQANWGNTVVIRHGEAFYSALSHLEPESLRVSVGQFVRRGEIVALCGSSGRSPRPHLHFQFQSTDQIGEKTIDHPLGYYIEHKSDKQVFRAASVPPEGVEIEPLVHSARMRRAFDLQLGRRWAWTHEYGDVKSVERWKLKTDYLNQLHIESTAGARAYCHCDDRLFYFSSFLGNRRSALHAFYLAAMHVPLIERNGVEWETIFPINHINAGWRRYIAEFGLPFGLPISAQVAFRLREHEENVVIESSAFASMWIDAVRTVGTGAVTIDRNGDVLGFEVVGRDGRINAAKPLIEGAEE